MFYQLKHIFTLRVLSYSTCLSIFFQKFSKFVDKVCCFLDSICGDKCLSYQDGEKCECGNYTFGAFSNKYCCIQINETCKTQGSKVILTMNNRFK